MCNTACLGNRLEVHQLKLLNLLDPCGLDRFPWWWIWFRCTHICISKRLWRDLCLWVVHSSKLYLFLSGTILDRRKEYERYSTFEKYAKYSAREGAEVGVAKGTLALAYCFTVTTWCNFSNIIVNGRMEFQCSTSITLFYFCMKNKQIHMPWCRKLYFKIKLLDTAENISKCSFLNNEYENIDMKWKKFIWISQRNHLFSNLSIIKVFST